MKWFITMLLLCFTFSTVVEGRGRGRSRSISIKKRTASVSSARRAPIPKPKARKSSPKRTAARSPSPAAKRSAMRSPSPPKRSNSFVSNDQVHSQKVRGNQGEYTKVGDPQKVKHTGNKTLGVKQKTFYRGVKDTANLPKGNEKSYVDNTFKNGIPSNARIKENVPGVHDPKKPAVTNVWQHQNKSAENSAFVATTSSKKVAAKKYSGPSGGYFEIQPKKSKVIDVNKTVGKSTDKAKRKDKEFLFTNEVPRNEIKAFHKVDGKGKVIETQKNPFFGSE